MVVHGQIDSSGFVAIEVPIADAVRLRRELGDASMEAGGLGPIARELDQLLIRLIGPQLVEMGSKAARAAKRGGETSAELDAASWFVNHCRFDKSLNYEQTFAIASALCSGLDVADWDQLLAAVDEREDR